MNLPDDPRRVRADGFEAGAEEPLEDEEDSQKAFFGRLDEFVRRFKEQQDSLGPLEPRPEDEEDKEDDPPPQDGAGPPCVCGNLECTGCIMRVWYENLDPPEWLEERDGWYCSWCHSRDGCSCQLRFDELMASNPQDPCGGAAA